MSPEQIWAAALGELQLQVARPFYDTFLSGSVCLGVEDGSLVVGAPSPFAAEYLEKRLHAAIQETVEALARQPMGVRFRVAWAGGTAPSGARGSPSPPAATGPGGKPREARWGLSLNAKYTFESFVVGGSNELASAAAAATAARPGQKHNPLFLYSGVGLGKTHLLQAIGHRLSQRGLNLVYVSSDQFTTEFVSSIREGRAQEFRHRYRSAEALLLDDVQLLAGKEQTQEGLFHIFNELHQSDRQIVVTCDRSPRALTALEDRLRSRLGWGLIADIQPPALETRIAILRSKAEGMGVAMDDEALESIGRRATGSIRELEGLLNRVAALAELTGEPVTPRLVSRAIGALEAAPTGRGASPEGVVGAVASFYRTTPQALSGPRRDRATAGARHVAMYLLREDLGLSLADIGRLMGGRDHSTVLSACGKVAALLEGGGPVRQEVASIRGEVARGADRPERASRAG